LARRARCDLKFRSCLLSRDLLTTLLYSIVVGMTYFYRGGKLRGWQELSRDHQASLLHDLIHSFSLLRSPDKALSFITNLLTADEVKILSKRLAIAKLLLKGSSYDEVCRSLKTSPVTVAKVASWLKEKGEGFAEIISRIPQRKIVKNTSDFPKSAWPLKMLEDLERAAVKSGERKLKNALADLMSKDVMRKRLQEQFEEERIRRRDRR